MSPWTLKFWCAVVVLELLKIHLSDCFTVFTFQIQWSLPQACNWKIKAERPKEQKLFIMTSLCFYQFYDITTIYPPLFRFSNQGRLYIYLWGNWDFARTYNNENKWEIEFFSIVKKFKLPRAFKKWRWKPTLTMKNVTSTSGLAWNILENEDEEMLGVSKINEVCWESSEKQICQKEFQNMDFVKKKKKPYLCFLARVKNTIFWNTNLASGCS